MSILRRYLFLSLALMAILFVLCLGARITGIFAHEVLGLVLSALFILHALRHRSWFKGFYRSRLSLRTLFSAAVNLSLSVCTLIILITGICLSPDIFKPLGLPSDMFMRELHSGAAFWMLIILGVHLGLHGTMIITRLSQLTHAFRAPPFWLFICAAGLIGFFDRMLFEKLFLGFAFDFWDPARPLSLYFIFYGCVIVLIACATHWPLSLGHRRDALFRPQNSQTPSWR